MASAPAAGIPFLQAPALGRALPPGPRPCARVVAQPQPAPPRPPPVGAGGTDGAIILFIPPEGPRCSGGSSAVVRHIIRHVNGQCGGLEGVGSRHGGQASSLMCRTPIPDPQRSHPRPTRREQGPRERIQGSWPPACYIALNSRPSSATSEFSLSFKTPCQNELCAKDDRLVDGSPVKFPSSAGQWVLQLTR